MHYTGTIWRPPYEAASLLLEVTAGCTHHKCKFCTLYHDLPFKFRMSSMEDIEEDLQEVQRKIRHWDKQDIRRVFLTGANPFVLSYDKLMAIAELHAMGYDGLTIGIETGDDEAGFFYMVGISGAGRGESGAKETADICNQLNPILIGANMLTIYPDSELFHEIRQKNWQEESELEKYKEVRTLIENLSIKTTFAALGASNAFQLHGTLSEDKEKLLAILDEIIGNVSEEELQRYRKSVHHL